MLDKKFFLILIFFNAFLYPQPFNNDKILDTSGTNLVTQSSGSISVDAEGNLGVCWIETAYDGDIWIDRLLYSKSGDHGNNFEKILVDTFACYYWDCHFGESNLLYDSENHLWLTYVSAFEQDYGLLIKKSTDDGATFSSSSLEFGAMSSPRYSICSGTSGDFYILWQLYSEMLRCTKIKNGNLSDTATSFITAPGFRLASSDVCFGAGEIYAVFAGKIINSYKIHFTKSTDGGLTFSVPIRIDSSVDMINQVVSKITFWDNKICLIFSDNRDGEYALYYSESVDFGLTFSPALKISEDENKPVNFSYFLSGNSEFLNVTWSSITGDLFFSSKRSPDNTFSYPVKVGNPSYFEFFQYPLGIAADNEGFTYIMFYDNRSDTNYSGENRIFLSDAHFTMSDIKDNSTYLNDFYLSQNYPNPFNPTTIITYSLPEYACVTIKIFDILGNEIETLVNEEKPAGTYEVTWNAAGLASGVYYYQLKAGGALITREMMVLK